MKKIMAVILSLSLILGFGFVVQAAEPMEREVYINREDKGFTTIVHDGVEYISVNKILETIEYEQRWDADTQTLTLWSPYRDMQFTVGSTTYYYNGFINHSLREYDLQDLLEYKSYHYRDIAECKLFDYKHVPIILDSDIYIPLAVALNLFSATAYIEENDGVNIDVLKLTYYDIYNEYSSNPDGISLIQGTRNSEILNSRYGGFLDTYFSLNNPLKYEETNSVFEFNEGVVKEVLAWNDPEEWGFTDVGDNRDWYIVVLEDGSEYWTFNGSKTTYNTRCFDNDFNEIKPNDMKSLVGKVVRFAQKHKILWPFWYDDAIEHDRFPYAMVLDKVATAELQEERSKTQEVEEEQPVQTQPTYYSGNIKVLYNNEEITFDQEPVIEDGRTLVPMRKIFETLGAEVDWDGDAQMVTAYKDDTEIKLLIDETTALKNSAIIHLDVPARLINDRTMVPVRFIADCLGVTTDWDGDTRTVYLYD